MAALAAPALVGWWRDRNVGEARRGERIAERSGCFGCHGPGGATGFEEAAEGVGSVPPLSREALRSYAENEAELVEWVRDGMPRRLRAELEEFPLEGPPPLVQMPDFGEVLSEREIHDLARWLGALAGCGRPEAGEAAEGWRAAERLGCFTCHGPGGRVDRPNPGSLMGYVPAWDGRDFPELVRDDAELREWILDGAPDRLLENPLARRFLERQVLKMPAYRGRVESSEVEAIAAYIRWLREGA
jgi:mono/diheme cytochrome c family protein